MYSITGEFKHRIEQITVHLKWDACTEEEYGVQEVRDILHVL